MIRAQFHNPGTQISRRSQAPETKYPSGNFFEARKRRREIIQQLKYQQAADSLAAMQISTRILAGQRKIVDSLCQLLLSYTPEKTPSKVERERFRSVVPDPGLDEWLRLRQSHSMLKAEKVTRDAVSGRARAIYENDSPMGFASRWFMDDDAKKTSLSLKTECNRLESEAQSTQIKVNVIESGMKSSAGVFLRRGLTTAVLGELARWDSPIQGQIQKDMSEMSVAVDGIWRQHAERQQGSLAQLEESENLLSSYYKAT